MHLKSSSHCLEPFNIPRWGKGAVNCIGIKFVCCGMHGGHDKDIYLFMKPSLAFNFNVWSLTIRKKKHPKKPPEDGWTQNRTSKKQFRNSAQALIMDKTSN